MGIFRAIPVHIILLIAYFFVVHLTHGGDAAAAMNVLVKQMQLPSGATIVINAGDTFVMMGVLLLFFELMKSTSSSMASVIDHLVSMIVFIGFLLAFILLPSAGHPVFLVLTLVAFVDVIAGFTITIVSARRDISVEEGAMGR
uniref:Uncharacterized protein n=1 Tax=Magnetococcus massalia (strain MO-1) TaxID=451514 RepID=A0A1S7LF08_MAGMO|nr:conserved membrane protein of unknown function [Candidatus Magnetococcus massalia]